MAIREDPHRPAKTTAPFLPLNLIVASLALALAFIAVQSPFI